MTPQVAYANRSMIIWCGINRPDPRETSPCCDVYSYTTKFHFWVFGIGSPNQKRTFIRPQKVMFSGLLCTLFSDQPVNQCTQFFWTVGIINFSQVPREHIQHVLTSRLSRGHLIHACVFRVNEPHTNIILNRSLRRGVSKRPNISLMLGLLVGDWPGLSCQTAVI